MFDKLSIKGTEHCKCLYEFPDLQQPCSCAIEDGRAGTYHCNDFNESKCACEKPCPQCTELLEDA